MRFSSLSLLAILIVPSEAFLPLNPRPTAAVQRSLLFSSLKEEEKTETKKSTDAVAPPPQVDPDAEGLPWWWEMVWDLDMMKLGEPGTAIEFGDSANVLRTNIEQIYGGYPSLDGCPLAEGELTDIGDGTMFIGLQNYYNEYAR